MEINTGESVFDRLYSSTKLVRKMPNVHFLIVVQTDRCMVWQYYQPIKA
jgi:hypothetical protein